MDNQLKRGLLDVCVLAAIKSEDSYGYKIIKDMKPYIDRKDKTGKWLFGTVGFAIISAVLSGIMALALR